MRRRWRWVIAAVLFLAGNTALWLVPSGFTLTKTTSRSIDTDHTVQTSQVSKEPPIAVSTSPEEAYKLTDKIDQLIVAEWDRKGVKPAPVADDAEFLRRVSLDVIGRIPSVAEVRAFVADTATGKRKRLVERLLDSPGYVSHFVNTWRAVLLPQASSKQIREDVLDFETWLRWYIGRNFGFDQLIREIVAPAAYHPGLAPFGFYAANEHKPENLAGSTARLFLGIHLECAQCHDHPFDHWKRKQFWEFAAFFGRSALGSSRCRSRHCGRSRPQRNRYS